MDDWPDLKSRTDVMEALRYQSAIELARASDSERTAEQHRRKAILLKAASDMLEKMKDPDPVD